MYGVYLLGKSNDNAGNMFLSSKTVIADDEKELAEDQYEYTKFTIKSTKIIEIALKNLTNNGFEVFIFDEVNFEKFKESDSSNGVLISIPGSYETIKSYTLAAGTYYLVIDNTDYGNIVPSMNFSDDIVILEIEAYYK